jgi:hypothetical protein
MIVFNLSCQNNHRFEGWFASAANFENQRESRQLSCPVCGSDEVARELHAPYVNTGAVARRQDLQPAADASDAAQAVKAKNVAELAQVVEKLIAATEDVGDDFPEEARKIHYQESPDRGIRGNASPDEISELREEGIEVISVPIPKHRLGNTH